MVSFLIFFFQKDIDGKTCPLWSWLNVVTMSSPDKFVNPRYKSDYDRRYGPRHRFEFTVATARAGIGERAGKGGGGVPE